MLIKVLRKNNIRGNLFSHGEGDRLEDFNEKVRTSFLKKVKRRIKRKMLKVNLQEVTKRNLKRRKCMHMSNFLTVLIKVLNTRSQMKMYYLKKH